MRCYRTEIVIPPDRTVVLHLPAHLPEGPAFVVVQVGEAVPDAALDDDQASGEREGALELDHEDMEWWDEFEDPSTPDDPEAAPVEPAEGEAATGPPPGAETA